jgi:hypothetical protein
MTSPLPGPSVFQDLTTTCGGDVYTVPPGKELVAEYFSAWVPNPENDQITAAEGYFAVDGTLMLLPVKFELQAFDTFAASEAVHYVSRPVPALASRSIWKERRPAPSGFCSAATYSRLKKWAAEATAAEWERQARAQGRYRDHGLMFVWRAGRTALPARCRANFPRFQSLSGYRRTPVRLAGLASRDALSAQVPADIRCFVWPCHRRH